MLFLYKEHPGHMLDGLKLNFEKFSLYLYYKMHNLETFKSLFAFALRSFPYSYFELRAKHYHFIQHYFILLSHYG